MKTDNPFPGLQAFGVEESHLFFGRERPIDELLRKLRTTRLIAVVGTSGSGKSSLVRAGMLPELHGGMMTSAGSSWRVALFRPGNAPIRVIAEALSQPEVFGSSDVDAELKTAITETVLRRGARGLVSVTLQARMPSHENLLVVVDLFEELFRFKRASLHEGASDEASAFVKLLIEASIQVQTSIYVVLTMRSEFLGDCTQFQDLPEAINAGQYLVPRMTRDQQKEAITCPVAVGGARITPRLLQRLLNDVGDKHDQLPILHHAMMRTWVNEESESARIYKRLEETSALFEKNQAGLWRNPGLQIALQWRELNNPNEAWAQRYFPGFDSAPEFLKKARLPRSVGGF